MKRLLLTLATILLSNHSFATTESEDINSVKSVTNVNSENFIFEGPSDANRVDKTITATAQVYGIGPSLGLSSGLDLGYFLNHKSLILLEATIGDDQDFGKIGNNLITNSIGVHIKRFFGNSFYLRTGLDQRHISYNYNHFSNSDFDNSRYYKGPHSFEASSTALSLALGNEWQWQYFTLGCHRIGVVQPIATQFQNENNGGDVNNSAELKSDENRLVSKANFEAFRFYLGASF